MCNKSHGIPELRGNWDPQLVGRDCRRRRKEIHRELFFETFPTLGVEPHLAERLRKNFSEKFKDYLSIYTPQKTKRAGSWKPSLPIWKGTSSEPNLHDFWVSKMLVFRFLDTSKCQIMWSNLKNFKQTSRPEETLQGVQYLWRTSHHDEFNMELQPEEVQMSSGWVGGCWGAWRFWCWKDDKRSL